MDRMKKDLFGFSSKMKFCEIMESDHGEHSFEPLTKKRKSHVVKPGYGVIEELEKVVKHLHDTHHILPENKKKIAMMAQEILDILKHEN